MSEQDVEIDPHYYDGWRGGIRLFREALVELPGLLYEDVSRDISRFRSKLRGEGDVDEESCGLKNCARKPVSMHSPPDEWRPDIPICRRHWLGMVVVKVLAYGLLLSITATAIYMAWVMA